MSSQADVLVWEDVGFKPSSLRGLSRFDTVAHIFVKCWVVWHFDLIQVLFFSNLKTEQFFETLKWKSVRIIETLRQFYGDSTDQSCCFHLDEVINGESGKAPKQHQGRKAFSRRSLKWLSFFNSDRRSWSEEAFISPGPKSIARKSTGSKIWPFNWAISDFFLFS